MQIHRFNLSSKKSGWGEAESEFQLNFSSRLRQSRSRFLALFFFLKRGRISVTTAKIQNFAEINEKISILLTIEHDTDGI